MKIPKLKVGDKVRLTKSDKNWSRKAWVNGTSMDAVLTNNPIVEITEIVNEINGEIKFANYNGWCWRFTDGHFELYEEALKLPENENYNNLIKLLQEIQ